MVTKDYDACKEISKTFTLVVDTRERDTDRYHQRIAQFEDMGLENTRHVLFAGDYSAIAKLPSGRTVDYTRRISLERKADIEELIKCYGPERKRFEAELQRAHKSGCKLYVVIESGSYADLVAGNYQNHHDVKNVLATYHAFEQRYNCSFVFVTPETFPTFVYETLRRYIMDDLCSKCKKGEITVA